MYQLYTPFRKLVDMEVWNDIDEQRRKRRLTRKERDKIKGKNKL